MRPDTTGPPPFGTRRCGHERENGLVLCIADSRPDRGRCVPFKAVGNTEGTHPPGSASSRAFAPAISGPRSTEVGAHRRLADGFAARRPRSSDLLPQAFPLRKDARIPSTSPLAAGTRRYDALIETPTF
jgi:hypothetical protein